MQLNIALFVSGSGSLLPSFFDYESKHDDFEVSCVIASRECAANDKARDANKDLLVTEEYGQKLLDFLTKHEVNVICLAGFLKILPAEFIQAFPGQIYNTHPSLLPAFGGLGMYGDKVHQAVIEAKETETGFTVIKVTEDIDAGPIVHQERVSIDPNDDWQAVKANVQMVEKRAFPKIVHELVVNSV